VGVAELEQARHVAPIASVQNRYNLADRASEDVLSYAEKHDIAFIPWFPLATGSLAQPGSPLRQIATQLGATPSQLALAWLLQRSPAVLPIPGTSSVTHLEENIAAAGLSLTRAQADALSALDYR
jgi:pyridoxine 4-dehydrogenase